MSVRENYFPREMLIESVFISVMTDRIKSFPIRADLSLRLFVNSFAAYSELDAQCFVDEQESIFNLRIGEISKGVLEMKKIDSKILECFSYLTKPYSRQKDPRKKDFRIRFKDYWNPISKHGACPLNYSFTFPYEIIKKVQDVFLPSLKENQKRDILGIGEAMESFVHQDYETFLKTQGR